MNTASIEEGMLIENELKGIKNIKSVSDKI
jgi:hypothetical protein